MTSSIEGLWPPVATAFRADGEPDHAAIVAHSRTLLQDGAAGLALLGTTSEANSLTADERIGIIDAHLAAGIPASKLLPGTGSCSVVEAARLTRHAGDAGAAGVLLLPPFFYKSVKDDGLIGFVGRIIDRAGSNVPPILLYHIPPVAVIGWSIELVGRLRDAFPGVIVGIKDSSGDPASTQAFVDAFPGFSVFPGAEVYLVKAMAGGAVGCISASANVNARGISQLIAHWRSPDAEKRQREANAIRSVLERSIMIPSLKAILAARYRNPTWLNMREPLLPLPSEARQALLAEPAIAGLLRSYEPEPA